MAQRLLYEDDQHRVGKVLPAMEGTFLAGGDRVQWRRLDGASIPYTSQASGVISNVSMALDFLLGQVNRTASVLAELERIAARIDTQNGAILTDVNARVADLNRYMTEVVTKIQRNTHREATVSITSNPALTLDNQSQTVGLNLAAKGSFDDSRARLGATSVQLALESLAAQGTESKLTVQMLIESLGSVQESQRRAEKQIADLAGQIADLRTKVTTLEGD